MVSFDYDEVWGRICSVMGWKRQKEMAAYLNINSSSITGAKARGEFPIAWAVKIAQSEKISTDWLLTGENPLRPDGQAPAYDTDEFAYVAFTTAQLAAGGGMVAQDGLLSRYAFRKEWLHKIGVDPKHSYLFIIKGDSMTPTLRDGDVVLVDTDKTRIYDGRIYAVNTGGDLLQIKRLEQRGKYVRLISDNKKLHEPLDEPSENVRVLGQAVWLGRQIAGFDEGE